MSAKECSTHSSGKRHKLLRGALAWLFTIVVLILFVILIVWLTLRPTHPRFYLQDATVLSFNLSSPASLTAVIQVTLSSRNPNDRIGVFYDKLDVYAVYKNQQITLATAIPPLYQGHNDVEVWSPYLYGTAIPMAPYLAAALEEDEAAGFMVLYVRLNGWVRWKVGSWTSGHYHMDVSCPAYMSFDGRRGSGGGGGDGGGGVGFMPAIRFQQLSTCSVDV